MKTTCRTSNAWRIADVLACVVVAALVATAIAMIFLVAPQEATMGDIQRIVYVHVSVAWCSLLGMILVGICGAAYLWRRNLAWDSWAQGAAEIGWLCSLLTLVTGSLWAHEAWNTWWTWDPRLTATLILWAILSGYLLLRSGVEEPHRRARLGAIVGLLGLLDVPLIVMATRWFRGMHPVSPELDPTMRIVLLTSALCFASFFGLLLVCRRRQVESANRLDTLATGNL